MIFVGAVMQDCKRARYKLQNLAVALAYFVMYPKAVVDVALQSMRHKLSTNSALLLRGAGRWPQSYFVTIVRTRGIMVGKTCRYKIIKTPFSRTRAAEEVQGYFGVDFVQFCALVKSCKISSSEL